MSTYDYLSNDNIGRNVEVEKKIFTERHTTIYGDGSRSSVTTFG